MLTIIGLIIGVLIFATGLSYRMKEKDDPESRTIYTVAAVIGGLIAVGCAALLVL